MKKIIICLTLLFCSDYLMAQKNDVHINDLSKGEKHWAMWHPFAARKAKKIVPFVRNEVRQMIADNKIDSLIHGGQADAFRHALWMALTAKSIGEKKARKLGQLHEERNKEDFFKSVTEDESLQDSISCQMDLLNNDLGIAYGMGYKDKSVKEIEELILSGVMNGEFFMLFRNKKNQFLDCEGNVVDTKNRIRDKVWYLPYCLVPSNNTSEIPTH